MSYGTLQIEKMTTESGYSLGAGNASSFKNRLINGGMAIDQRNAGASFTPTDGQFGLDRWLMSQSTAGKYTCQQNAGGVTPPLGFAYYMGMTSTSAYSVTSTDFYGFQQRIEANNFNDWGWGTASAKDATLSFWVYSSLTGTFGGAIRSGNFGIAYIFSYTITAANTWQYVTVPITGPTTGNFGSGNSLAVGVVFSIGSGTNYLDTPGSWLSGSSKLAPTGQTSVVGTNGATFYITGTQFEVGTVATSFDFRDFGRELILCQRYFEKSYPLGTAVGTATAVGAYEANNTSYSNSIAYGPPLGYKVIKRTSPTVTAYDYSGAVGLWHYARNGVAETTVSFTVSSTGNDATLVPRINVGAAWVPCYVIGHWIASAEL